MGCVPHPEVGIAKLINTKEIAESLHRQVGGVLVHLELVNPYPQNYRAQVAQVVRGNNSGFLPPLKTNIDSIDKFWHGVRWFSHTGLEDAASDEKFFEKILSERQDNSAL